MSDAALIAGQLQDVVTSIDDVAVAIRDRETSIINIDVPSQLPPVINIEVPRQLPPNITVTQNPPEAPVINVSPAIVNLSPIIDVHSAPPVAYNVRITSRTKDGYISSFTI